MAEKNEVRKRESHLRSILKTLSWRIIATTTTVICAYIVFGDISNALKVGYIEFFAKMFIYYFHERLWQLAPRGFIRRTFGMANSVENGTSPSNPEAASESKKSDPES